MKRTGLQALGRIGMVLALGGLARAQFTVVEEVDLTSPSLPTLARFGFAVAIDGPTAVVSQRQEGSFQGAGLVLVYERTGATWAQADVLPAPATQSSFGDALDLCGDTVAVAAPTEEVGSVPNAGAVYVFVRDGAGWTQQARLVPSTPYASGSFGSAVALDGDTLLVGIQDDDDVANGAGAVSVFVRAAGVWTEEAKLTQSSGAALDGFGMSLALSGDLAAVGQNRGAADLTFFERESGAWTEVDAYVEAGTLDNAGAAVATDGAQVFAQRSLGGSGTLSVLVFERDSGGWAVVDELFPSDPVGVSGFGNALAVDGGFLAVGARTDGLGAVGGGAVHLFAGEAGSWTETAKFTAAAVGEFSDVGWDVDVSESRVIAGAPQHDASCPSFEPGCNAGGAFVFRTRVDAPAFCDASDASLAACPCGNPGSPDSGCDLAQGTGGVALEVLEVETSPQNRIRLLGTGYPPNSTPASVAIRAPALEAVPVVFGDGLRCVGTSLVRVRAAFAIGGASEHEFGHGAGPGTFHYQLWFRNVPAASCTPAAFNLSNGRSVTW